MSPQITSQLPEILKAYEAKVLADWLDEQKKSLETRKDGTSQNELAEQSKQLLNLIQEAVQSGEVTNINNSAWKKVRDFLEEVSRARTERGYTTEQTATFIFSLKQPLFSILRKEFNNDPEKLFREIWVVTILIDKLGLFIFEAYQRAREGIIKRQQEELLELSTPVLKLWEGILALPMIGTLDSNRTQIIMETLLQKILENNCEVAIIDITGVPNVDTLVAQHLLKTVTAARLMGTECIISGIRPQIAQTIVHLGVELSEVTTKATLVEAFKKALAMTKQGLERENVNHPNPI